MKDRYNLNGAQPLVIDCEGMNARELFVKEELDMNANGDVGLRSVKGTLLMAMESGTPVVLRNLSKSQIGSDGALLPFVQFLNGERNDYTAFALDGSVLDTYSRDKLKPSFFMMNEALEDVGAEPLSAALQSRLRTIAPVAEQEKKQRETLSGIEARFSSGTDREVVALPQAAFKKKLGSPTV